MSFEPEGSEGAAPKPATPQLGPEVIELYIERACELRAQPMAAAARRLLAALACLAEDAARCLAEDGRTWRFHHR